MTSAHRSRQRRYPDGGGLTAEGRARREAVRLQAAALFARDMPVAQIARLLQVSRNAVYVWRRRWLSDREAGLVSKGPSGTGCRLSQLELETLAAALREGPAAHGFLDDPRWTLARVADLIARQFHVRYSQRGLSILLQRMGVGLDPPATPVDRADAADPVDGRPTARSPRSLRAGP